ncbi:MAG: tryptophan--tRNA ligase [Candidatus Micrarchaeota archaeon]|nr:tryptophan--tRNA ligase [Candidatus Micrarchaeota archaeon]
MEEIDPWGNGLVEYANLFREFGMQKISPETAKRLAKSRLFRRGIIFAHRDFDRFIQAHDKGEPVAAMSGIKPSGEFHLGSKMTAEELIFMQKEFGAKVFYAIADLEAYADNGLGLAEGAENAVSNVADMLALGLDTKNAYVWRQSNEKRVMNLAYIFSRRTTLATLQALYGERNMGLYLSVLTQAGDILLPQLKDFEGPKEVVVPVGADQDPHIRFTRDIAQKFNSEYGFVTPCATYHMFFRSLNGETKMSKRDPMNILTLADEGKALKQKLSNTFTGGRATAEEQRKLGGETEKCVIYELMKFHFYENDEDLKKMYEDCRSGKILCGECKKIRIEKITEYLKAHQEKKKKMMEKARKLVDGSGE